MEDEFDDADNFSVDDEEIVEFDDELDDDIDESNCILGDQKKNDLIDYRELYNNYKLENKVTKPYICKFERIKIISIRAQQLANGAIPTIAIPPHITQVDKIAELEYKAKRIPFMIRRYRADNTYEDWRLTDFVNIH